MLVVLGVWNTGGGLRHERLRVWVPSPQVVLHWDHAPQFPTGATPYEPINKEIRNTEKHTRAEKTFSSAKLRYKSTYRKVKIGWGFKKD